MGKVGLITFYENNYGSILQCYATKYFLENHGYNCVVVSCKEVQQPNLVNKVGKYLRVAVRSLVFKSYYNDFETFLFCNHIGFHKLIRKNITTSYIFNFS